MRVFDPLAMFKLALLTHIGEVTRDIRHVISLNDIGVVVGIDAQTVSKLTRGVGTLNNALLLAHALGVEYTLNIDNGKITYCIENYNTTVRRCTASDFVLNRKPHDWGTNIRHFK